MIDVFRGLKNLIKISHVHIDSTIFRLHYTFTVMCLLGKVWKMGFSESLIPAVVGIVHILSQCGDWVQFLTILILREINFDFWLISEGQKWHFNHFAGFGFWFLEKIPKCKCQIFPLNEISEMLEWWKWHFWPSKISKN